MISKFFKFFFKTFYGLCAALGFVVFFGALLIYHYSLQKPSTAPVHENTFLTVTLQGDYPDYLKKDSLKHLLKREESSLYDLLTTLDAASQDPKITGLVMTLKTPGIGLAQLQELRDAILKFKKTGKPTLIYADSYGEMTSGLLHYYLASACDEIWMQPIGMLNILGLRLEQPYARDALEKIGVTPEFGGRKEYKSFVEMFTLNAPSEPAKEAQQAMLDSITSQVVEALAKSRKMNTDQILNAINNSPYTDLEANELKLIDRLEYRQNLKPALEERYGHEKALHFLDFLTYQEVQAVDKIASPFQDHVALVFDAGAINSSDDDAEGLMRESFISSARTYHIFMELLKDPHVKSIVYRISSPGGSPVASETIASVIRHAKTKGIPVVVSMGDYAASGGYWVSTEGSKIFAEPFTLTGSIGVFTGKFVIKDLWEKLGIHWAGASFGKNSGLDSMNTTFSPEEWERVNAFLDRIYSSFVNKVATRRKLSPDAVEKAAKGRVWTGEQAQSLGLVDQLGGLQDAIMFAKLEAKLDSDAEVLIYPKPKSLLEELSEKLLGHKGHGEEEYVQSSFLPIFKLWKSLQMFAAKIHLLMGGEVLEASLPEVR
ncbi:Signal peptide peptidase SppA [Candidatus Bealeia paramacronuclearis]|uniref:Signal peptide peptidase SppA n=1 Tax=Candidatus Bealeia paramacronuclearis TaxID=1921001 RepID=A0ABZ2C4Q9_9PROT|nr:Signal peptide peptidase SppA [Candidatus Bealeia paramacronuclearis]